VRLPFGQGNHHRSIEESDTERRHDAIIHIQPMPTRPTPIEHLTTPYDAPHHSMRRAHRHGNILHPESSPDNISPLFRNAPIISYQIACQRKTSTLPDTLRANEPTSFTRGM
jgi:hypothetical protein